MLQCCSLMVSSFCSECFRVVVSGPSCRASSDMGAADAPGPLASRTNGPGPIHQALVSDGNLEVVSTPVRSS